MERRQKPNAGDKVEQQEHSLIAGANAKWYGHLKTVAAVSWNTKHNLIVESNNHAPSYLAKWDKNMCLPKNLHMDIYDRFIHNF